MAEYYPGYNPIDYDPDDGTDEFGRVWDPASHVDPVDAQWQPPADMGEYSQPEM